jgi:hypothetical protein
MLRFQIAISALPSVTGGQLYEMPTFDEALAQLSLFPRMFIEPDGSFVWRGSDEDGGEWQVDGNLIDRGDVLAYVELKGCCPAERFDELISAVGWPQQPLAFQLPRRGVVLDETEFRRLAATEAGAV